MSNYIINKSTIHIRKETSTYYNEVHTLIKEAFKNVDVSDHREQFLVENLRKSENFIPEFSLVAEYESKIVGHILLTRIKIKNQFQQYESLALAPVSVLPQYQNQGIGGLLIKTAHKIARKLQFKSVILLGHPDYYPKFGYKKASDFGIKLPFEVPLEYCMAIELVVNGLSEVSGTVEYPKEFYC